MNKYGEVEPMLGKKVEPLGSASSESESCSDSYSDGELPESRVAKEISADLRFY